MIHRTLEKSDGHAFRIAVFAAAAALLILSCLPVKGDFSPTPYYKGQIDYANALVIHPDGKISVAGATGFGRRSSILARYRPDGSLDESFSGDGRSTLSIAKYDGITSAALGPRGKLWIGGTYTIFSYFELVADAKIAEGPPIGLPPEDYGLFLAQVDDAGELIPGFGQGGDVMKKFAYGYCVAVQPDGKALIAGSTSEPGKVKELLVLRFHPDGTPDDSFGVNGEVVTALGGSFGEATSMVVQPDGRILVLAGIDRYLLNKDFALVRYLPGGSLDPSFGKGGTTFADIDDATESPSSLALQTDGKILVGGSTIDSVTGFRDFLLVRFDAGGAVDTTFGKRGKVATDFTGKSDFGSAVAIQEDGKIILAGTAWNGTDYDFAVARYHPNGLLDTTFHSDGKVTTDFFGPREGGASESGRSVVIQPDGKIVVAGNAWPGSRIASDFAVVRYLPDGRLDESFSDDGRVTTDFTDPPFNPNLVPRDQPDLHIRTRRIPKRGDDIHNLTGEGQTVRTSGKGGRPAEFSFTAENDGQRPDTLALRVAGRGRHFRAVYFRLTPPRGNVTAELTGRRLILRDLEPDEAVRFTARIFTSPGVARSKVLPIVSTSRNSKIRRDVVKTIVNARRK